MSENSPDKGGWAFQPDINGALGIRPATGTGSHLGLERRNTLPRLVNQRITANAKCASTPNALFVADKKTRTPARRELLLS